MTQELVIEEVKRQAKHYSTLGKDKPEDHEHNILARGLLKLAENMPRPLASGRVYTCEVHYTTLDVASIINMRRYGHTLEQAEKNCGCLKGCGAVAFDLIIGPAQETLTGSQVMEQLDE